MSINDAGQVRKKPIADIVHMEHLTSGEYIFRDNQKPVRILEDVSLLIKRGEVWSISGLTLPEIRLLLEIMANIRPYHSGRCILAERGMMRHKRIILKHVFYIADTEMLYENMTVLEYLTFAAHYRKSSDLLLQDELFEFIIGAGLGRISLTPIKLLTAGEKAVITLIAAVYSESLLIVFNFPEFDFDDVLTGAIRRISDIVRENGKALVIGTNSYSLTEAACSHAAFLAGGRIIYSGTVEDLRFGYDPVELIVRGNNLSELAERLSPMLPGYVLQFGDNSLHILNRSGSDPEGFIHKKIIESGILPESIEINPKTVRNAYKELLRQNDLPDELL